MTFLALLTQGYGEFQVNEQWNIEKKSEPIMALKLIKPRHHADTPGHKRRGVLSSFYDPHPLKLRKLDP